MLTFRVFVPKAPYYTKFDGMKFDTIYMDAMNASTALLDAVRWYDTFINKRDKDTDPSTYRTALVSGNVRPKPGEYRVHQYIVWYAIDGENGQDKVAVFSYGRNDAEVIRIAKRYGVTIYPSNQLRGILRVERTNE